MQSECYHFRSAMLHDSFTGAGVKSRQIAVGNQQVLAVAIYRRAGGVHAQVFRQPKEAWLKLHLLDSDMR